MALIGDIRKENKKRRTKQPEPPIDTQHLVRLLVERAGSQITAQEIYEAEMMDRLEAARVYYDDTLICAHPFVIKHCCLYCSAHVTDKENLAAIERAVDEADNA